MRRHWLDRGLYLLLNGLIYAGSAGLFLLTVRSGFRRARASRQPPKGFSKEVSL